MRSSPGVEYNAGRCKVRTQRVGIQRMEVCWATEMGGGRARETGLLQECKLCLALKIIRVCPEGNETGIWNLG